MPFDVVTTTFSAGMLDRSMIGRIETGIYNSGALILENFRPLVTGGLARRSGFRHMRTLDALHCIHSFTFNRTQRYIVGISADYLRVWDVLGQEQFYEIASPWTWPQIAELRLTQRADTMLFTHRDVGIYRLLRTGATSFVFEEFKFENNAAGTVFSPFYKYAEPATLMTSADRTVTGPHALTCNADYFDAGMIGVPLWLYENGETDLGKYAYGVIETVTDSRNATWSVLEDNTGGSGAISDTSLWYEAAFSDFRGWPQAVTFHGNRLYLGGSTGLPAHVFGSRSNAFFNFSTLTGLDDDGIAAPLAQDEVNEVVHLTGGQTLFVLTDQTCHYQPETDEAPITPSSWNPKQIADAGASRLAPPIRYDDQMVWRAQDGESVQSIVRESITGSLSHRGLSLPYQNIARNLTDAATWRAVPDRAEAFGCYIRGDGALVLLHSRRDEDVLGWFLWTTEGAFRSVCSSSIDLFVVAEREGVFTLEAYDPDTSLDNAVKGAVRADDKREVHVGFTVHASRTMRAASMYPNADNTVRGAMLDLGEQPVDASGVVTLIDAEAWGIVVGHYYEAKIRMLPPFLEIEGRTNLMELTRVISTSVHLEEGWDAELDGRRIQIKQAGQDFSLPQEPETTWKKLRALGWKKSPEIEITIPAPVDCTILAVKREVTY